MEIKKFENSLIAFDFDNEMVNATDILKSHPDKRMNDFLNLQSTKNYIEALSDILNTGEAGIIKTKRGKGGGTWVHRLLAYEVAKWVYPKLAVFVNMMFDNKMKNKLKQQQYQLDYFWDKEDQKDLYYKQ